MKKKIIFMLINMNVGGTEKALLNMLSELPEDTYDITLLFLEKYGGFLNSIPPGVKVEYVEGYKEMKDLLQIPSQKYAVQLFKKGKLLKGINLILLHLISKAKKERSLFYKYILKNYPVMKNEYDVAVAYAGPMDLISYFVVHKIKAKKKIQWIHFDITQIGFNREFASKLYKQFDKIFAVSNEGKERLVNKLPSLKDKIDTFQNIISTEMVVKMANEGLGFSDNFEGIRILTVGRLSKEKGQDMAIRVLAKLKQEGFRVRWYCVGEGIERKNYEKMIEQYNLENDFVLLGAHLNPYPFMKQCDIYVQSSRHEGYCITLAEARCFDNPIVSTNFTGAAEQIQHNETGILVNFDENEMFGAISRLLNDDYSRKKIKNNLQRKTVIRASRKTNRIAENL